MDINNTAQFFDQIYSNSRQNAMMIMNPEGIILKVNDAFTTAYGYTTEDLHSSHFRILYTEKDQITRRPEIELNITHREGTGTDENYLVHKDGTPIWVSGESILIKTDDGTCIVKIIHNIHAQKQLERYLLSSTELLDSLFDSVQQSGLLLLDAQMKVIKTNAVFRKMFAITEAIPSGSRLQEIGHPFWNSDEIKTEIRNNIVNSIAINNEFIVNDGDKKMRHVHITSKIIWSEAVIEKRLLLMIKEI